MPESPLAALLAGNTSPYRGLTEPPDMQALAEQKRLERQDLARRTQSPFFVPPRPDPLDVPFEQAISEGAAMHAEDFGASPPLASKLGNLFSTAIQFYPPMGVGVPIMNAATSDDPESIWTAVQAGMDAVNPMGKLEKLNKLSRLTDDIKPLPTPEPQPEPPPTPAADVLAPAVKLPEPPPALAPLPEAPAHVQGPVPAVAQAAEQYAGGRGAEIQRQQYYAEADPIRGQAIAAEYERMKHAPDDPKVRGSYEALANETMQQWDQLIKSGADIDFLKPGQPDPYPGGPKEALADLRNNNHLWVFPTEGGFGPQGAQLDVTSSPMLRDTGIVHKGHRMLVNDAFRAVHDYFGHGMEGANFGARGEENAWQAHKRLFSEAAQPAMTSETRGQNSWVNFGPYGEANRANQRDTVFAEQKTGIMPEWTGQETGMDPNYQPQVDATWGDPNNPGALFEGVRPREFTPEQMGRFGIKHGVGDLGPQDTEKWIANLEPYTLPDGRVVQIPGGLDSKEPFTYYDKIFMKQQGINPNDLPEDVHGKIHDRFISSYMKNPPSDEAVFNQLVFAMISPNQPLSENELALSRAMVKGPEDIKRFAEAIPWNYKDAGNVSKEDRKTASQRISAMLGLSKKSAATPEGMGISGSADYSRMAEFAQKYQEDPAFFRFKGAGEGGATNAENWANYSERLANQISGLGMKTSSLGGVWQSPGTAAISAVDRHMLDQFGSAMFDTPGEFDAFKAATVQKYNTKTNKKGEAVKPVDSWDKLPKNAQHEAMFAVVNAHKEPQYALKKTGEVNPDVPEHLRDLPFDLTKGGGKKVQKMSEAYRNVNEATAGSRGADDRSVFAQQWLVWDRIRNRLEPHEITHAGLEKLPRMSMDEIQRVKADMEKAGYMKKGRVADPFSGVKKMQPVQPTPGNRQGFASRGAYWRERGDEPPPAAPAPAAPDRVHGGIAAAFQGIDPKMVMQMGLPPALLAAYMASQQEEKEKGTHR